MERFERAAKQELENIKEFIASRANDFHQISRLEIYDRRIELIAEIYLKTTTDINTAFKDFTQMYNEIKLEEASLFDKLEINISLDESAIDELISLSIITEEEAGSLAFQLANKLEYGLKLVRDRTGMENFVIHGDAVTDTENFINELIKKSYRQDHDPNYFDDHESY